MAYYSIVCVYYILSICSSVDGHLCYSHLLAVVHYAAMNMDMLMSLPDHVFKSLDIYLEVGLLDYIIVLCNYDII